MVFSPIFLLRISGDATKGGEGGTWREVCIAPRPPHLLLKTFSCSARQLITTLTDQSPHPHPHPHLHSHTDTRATLKDTTYYYYDYGAIRKYVRSTPYTVRKSLYQCLIPVCMEYGVRIT